MAEAPVTFPLLSSPFGYVQELLEALGAPIEGQLTVNGHPYWVILEFGSSPATQESGPSPDDIVPLNPPEEAAGGSKNHSGRYPIKAEEGKLLRFFKDGAPQFAVSVQHPGNIPHMHIRQIIQHYEEKMAQYLESLFDRDDDNAITREELLSIWDSFFKAIYDDVVADAPVGVGYKSVARVDELIAAGGSGHLQNAWGYAVLDSEYSQDSASRF